MPGQTPWGDKKRQNRDSELLLRVGQRVRELRAKRGISQEELAEASGVHRTYIGSLESGRRNVSLTNVGRIALALEVTLPQLFKGIRPSPKPTSRRPTSMSRRARRN